MTYAAVNAKIRARRGAAGSSETSDAAGELDAICCYLRKNDRDFLRKFAAGFRFYENLRLLATLDKHSRESLRRVFLTEINLRNILKIYRLKRFYNLNGDAILPYLAPAGSKEVLQLAQTAGIDEFMREASTGAGAAFAGNFAQGEKMLTLAVCAAFKREYRRENLAVACGFLYESRVADGYTNEIHKHNGAY
ncbi:MAG: V-type ATPase subunit [Defluviitaleaceae bacterium]|nr:V-type ATPase subunit [Defluviitaleaceae bacterium]